MKPALTRPGTLLGFLLLLLAALLVASAAGLLIIPSPNTIAPWTRHSLFFVFCGLLLLKVFVEPASVQQEKRCSGFDFLADGKLADLCWALLFLAIPLLCVYFLSLSAFPVFDDFAFLQVSTDIVEIPQVFFHYLVPRRGAVWYRPLLVVSFLFNYLVWGTNYVGWRLTSLIVHLANSWMVYRLAAHLTRRRQLGLLAGFLFAVHPLHPEAVTWIGGRPDVLAAFFYLGAFLAFIRFLQTRSKAWAGWSLLSYTFALMSKEVAITLPSVLLAYTMIWKKSDDERIETRGFGLIGLHALVMVAYLVFRIVTIGDIGGYREGTGAPSVFRPKPAIALFAFIVTPTLSFLFPFNRSIPIVGFLQPVIAFILAVPLVLLIVRSHVLRRQSVAFCLAFLLLSVLPMYHLLYISPELINSRYLYFPTVPLAIIAAELFLGGVGHLSQWKRNALEVSAMGMGAAFCLLTLLNNAHWKKLGEVAAKLPAALHALHPQLVPGTRLYIYGAPVRWHEYIVYGPYLNEAIRLFYGHRDFKVHDTAWEAWYAHDSFSGLPDLRRLDLGEKDLIFSYDRESRNLRDLSTQVKELVNRPSMRKDVVWNRRKGNDAGQGQGSEVELGVEGSQIPPGANDDFLVNLPTGWTPSSEDVFEIRMKADPLGRDATGATIYAEVAWRKADGQFGEPSAAVFPVIVDGRGQTYSAPIGRYIPWLLTARVAQMRFRLIPSPARMEIESIRLGGTVARGSNLAGRPNH